MNADQVNLLTDEERNQGSSYSVKNNGSAYLSSKSIRKNLLLLVLSLFIASSLTVYIYLNLVAINGNQSDQTRYKPQNRRKPMLDHESIFSDSGPSMIKLSDLMAHCIVALQVAGQEVVRMSLVNNERLEHVGSKGNTLEGADDVVTGADMISHDMILRTIKDSYRRLSIISEEDTTKIFDDIRLEEDILPIDRKEFAKRLRSNLYEIEGPHGESSSLIAQQNTLVWIDPLDATKEYSENLTSYVTLMACIVYKSVPIAGIIHKPFLNLTYWALRDETSGTFKHSLTLNQMISERKLLSESQDDKLRVIVSRSHAGDVQDTLERVFGDRVSIESAGGSGFKTLELLNGTVDAYVHMTHIKKWDICAPHAILASIHGGNMTDLRGGHISFGDPKEKVVTGGLVATLSPRNHNDLIKSLEESIPDAGYLMQRAMIDYQAKNFNSNKNCIAAILVHIQSLVSV